MEVATLTATFAALGDPVRQRIVEPLADGDATVNELAARFPISLQAVSKHIKVLEHAGVVSRRRAAQTRPVHLEAAVAGRHRRLARGAPTSPRDEVRAAGRAARRTKGDDVTNKRTVTAQAGQQTIEWTREFEAPAAARLRGAHRRRAGGPLDRPRGTALHDARLRRPHRWQLELRDGRQGRRVGVPRLVPRGHGAQPARADLRVRGRARSPEPRGDDVHRPATAAGAGSTGLSVFLTVEDRDLMLGDMDSGMDENFERLDEIFAAGGVS